MRQKTCATEDPSRFARDGLELDIVEKKATATGDLKTAGVVHGEHKEMDQGLAISPNFPPGLPLTLKAARKTYLDGFARITAEAAQRQQRIHADYLRDLAALGAKAPAGSPLAGQIDAEKEAVLGSAATTSTAPATASDGTNRIVNGNFTDAGADGFPKGWQFQDLAFVDPREKGKTMPAAVRVKATAEKGENRVAISLEKAKGFIAQVVEVPSRAKEITFKVHVRGQIDKGELQASCRFFDAAKKFLPTKDGLAEVGKLKAQTWTIIEVKDSIPKGTQIASVLLGAKGATTANVEFKQVEVRFR